MLKWIGLTALVAAAAVMTLGCVRVPATMTAAVEDKTSTVTPASAKAGITAGAVTGLWRDISVYRADESLRLAGPTYEVTSYETNTECEAARQAAMAKDVLSRMGPTTEQLADGIKTWDSDRGYYTTFRYLCWLGAGPARFR